MQWTKFELQAAQKELENKAQDMKNIIAAKDAELRKVEHRHSNELDSCKETHLETIAKLESNIVDLNSGVECQVKTRLEHAMANETALNDQIKRMAEVNKEAN